MRNRELLPDARPVYEQDRTSFQSRVDVWVKQCFGETSKTERNYRFIEEALELVQSLGTSKEEVLELVDYVFNRPSGEPWQEVGGTMTTLAALCNAHDLDMEESADRELTRMWGAIERYVRNRQTSQRIPRYHNEKLRDRCRRSDNLP